MRADQEQATQELLAGKGDELRALDGTNFDDPVAAATWLIVELAGG